MTVKLLLKKTIHFWGLAFPFIIYSFTIIDNVDKMFTSIAFFANLAFMI